jgi:hypothetical protein
VVYMDNSDNKELVTVTVCISAGGYIVPLMIIFKGTYYLYKHFENDTDSDILWVRSESRFTNDKLIYYRLRLQ